MEIKYTGTYYKQFQEIKNQYEDLINKSSNLEKELIGEIVYGKSIAKKKEAYKKLKEKNFKNFKLIFNYSQILSSFNKNKGQWLEDILNYVFERTNLFEKMPISHWIDGKILNTFAHRDFKINKKTIKAYIPIDLKYLQSVKDITFVGLGDISRINTKLIKYIEENNLKEFIKEIIYINGLVADADYFEVNIVFKQKIILSEKWIELLKRFNILDKHKMDLLKTDATILDKKNNSVFIIESKNTEKTGVKIEDLAKTLIYAIREKEFSKNRFKKLYIAYRGDVNEIIENSIDLINSNFQKYANVEIELIRFEDLLDYIKLNFFDDENKNNYRKKDITCWDFNSIKYIKAQSHEKRKYSPIFEILEKQENELLINLDFEFEFKNEVEKVKEWEKADKKSEDLNDELKRISRRLIENE